MYFPIFYVILLQNNPFKIISCFNYLVNKSQVNLCLITIFLNPLRTITRKKIFLIVLQLIHIFITQRIIPSFAWLAILMLNSFSELTKLIKRKKWLWMPRYGLVKNHHRLFDSSHWAKGNEAVLVQTKKPNLYGNEFVEKLFAFLFIFI